MENMEYQAEDFIPIVTELAAAYTGYEHSSITYETAEMLMEAVLYCVHEWENSQNCGLSAGSVPAKAAYEFGLQAVIQKTKELHSLYNRLILEFQDYGLKCLGDVVVKGIPAFLLRYDVKYAPQETLLTLDYPVMKDLSGLSGIDAVLEYVECICLEQRFLRKFENKYIVEILRAYSPEYEVLIENICGLALSNVMGHVILKKPLSSMGFDREEYDILERILAPKSQEELEEYFRELLKGMAEHSLKQEGDLLEYLSGGIGDLSKRVSCNAANHCLERVFLI